MRQAPALPAEFCLSNPHAAEPPDARRADQPVSDGWDLGRVPKKAYPVVPTAEPRFETAAVWECWEAAAADWPVAEAGEALPVQADEAWVRREPRTEHRHRHRDFRFWDAHPRGAAAVDRRSPVRDGTRSEHRDPERFAAGLGRPTEQAAEYPDQLDGPVAAVVFPVRFLRAEALEAEMPDAPQAVSSKALPPQLSGAYSPALPEPILWPEAVLLVVASVADRRQAADGARQRAAAEAARAAVARRAALRDLHRPSPRVLAGLRRTCRASARRCFARHYCARPGHACRREDVCRRSRRVRTHHFRLSHGSRSAGKCSVFLRQLRSYWTPRFRCGFAVVVGPNRRRRRGPAGS